MSDTGGPETFTTHEREVYRLWVQTGSVGEMTCYAAKNGALRLRGHAQYDVLFLQEIDDFHDGLLVPLVVDRDDYRAFEGAKFDSLGVETWQSRTLSQGSDCVRVRIPL